MTKKAFIALIMVLMLCYGNAEVIVITTANKTFSFVDIPANFGDRLPKQGLTGTIVNAIPRDGCSPIQPPPYTGPNWFALIRQGNCPYSPKVYNAQLAGYRAAIIFNRDSNELIQMNGVLFVNKIQIPSVFVGSDTGAQLSDAFNYISRSTIIITPTLPVPWSYYVTSLGTVAVTCVAIVLGVYQNKVARRRLDKTVPIFKYSEALDCQDMCAICIDDFALKDRIRILPCKHAYHCKCIDPWFLVEGKRNCPLCKLSIDANDSNQISVGHETVSASNNLPNVVVDVSESSSTENLLERSTISTADQFNEVTPLVTQHSNL
ncbi:uncharacterized protein TRIADDRAFT_59523 [Trichoplax adhaerens]|uniref:RING-type E3 ubiquitin transferase n=1 Tax=Trichoplax adhaerens TaxID=10228 RepID=B3S5V7_TRIAD|nr:hypothetical protein TRIADDRAFT_59523 [Trichoplax adhaerens]EDV21872.1 hypothetical protein TRIADDRAFT_59523 [Trichoplax adhaerens]|eukprot:XP_002115509.1 hypothetical protein TRIADDRAFT_59523 [Trichoplax adhaerens]